MTNRFTFRTWDKRKKKMLTLLKADSFMSDAVYLRDILDYYNDPNTYVLMQSTGIYDSNGKEIFEGDLLRMRRQKHLPETVEWVKRLGGYALVRNDCVADEEVFNPQCANCMEVVGNIYENPELKDLNRRKL